MLALGWGTVVWTRDSLNQFLKLVTRHDNNMLSSGSGRFPRTRNYVGTLRIRVRHKPIKRMAPAGRTEQLQTQISEDPSSKLHTANLCLYHLGYDTRTSTLLESGILVDCSSWKKPEIPFDFGFEFWSCFIFHHDIVELCGCPPMFAIGNRVLYSSNEQTS